MPVPTEAQEQAALIEWFTVNRWLFTATAQATPAGRMTAAGWKPAFGTLRKNRALGVRKGFPDLCVVPTGGSAIFIEMKRANGVPSDVAPEQSEWLEALNASGITAVVCCGFKEAKDCVDALLHGKEWKGRIDRVAADGCVYEN